MSPHTVTSTPRTTGHANRDKTHCHKGHRYTPENTYYRPDGRRACYICRREQSRTDQERKTMARTPKPEPTPPAPPLVVVDPDGLIDICRAMVETAWKDYHSKVNPKHYASAKKFLLAAGLLLPDGRIDEHGYSRYVRRERKG